MQINSLPLNIHIRNDQRAHKHGGRQPIDDLHHPLAAKRLVDNHEDARRRERAQQQHRVAIDAVKQAEPVPYDGHELEACEQRGWQHGGEVQEDADAVAPRAAGAAVVVAFARGGAADAGGEVAEDVVNIEEHEAGEGEAEEGADGDGGEEEVGPGCEVQGVADADGPWWWLCFGWRHDLCDLLL